MAKAQRKPRTVPGTPVTDTQKDHDTQTAPNEQIGEQVAEIPDPATEFDPAMLERQTDAQGQNTNEHAQSAQSHAEGVTKKSWPKIPDPFGIETINAGDNVVHLYRSDKDRAFLIRMDTNPNEGRAKDDPHPALAAIKEAGFRWSDALADGKKAWGKRWQDGQFHYTEEQEARKLVKKVAELLGPVRQQDPIPF
jgi:hypothetical protein